MSSVARTEPDSASAPRLQDETRKRRRGWRVDSFGARWDKRPVAGATSERLFREAQERIPGGVNSPVRAWRSVGGTPLFFESASGARLHDVDGRSYLDLVGSWGPMILGHADPGVVAAIRDAAGKGCSFGAPTPGEVELAGILGDAVPSIDSVRLTSSGTEATMSAIRVARGVTGRSKVLKFAGCYHGHLDALLVRAGSGATTLGIPDSAGVPEAVASLTRVAEFNALAEVEAYFRAEGREIAAVVVEPIAANMGVVPPAAGFLEGLRRVTREHGALLVFDEVITGFRVARGGAQELLGVVPDLTCLGKIIGGGLPVGAFGGAASAMSALAPLGGVYQAGTLSGNPLAVAAGIATLARLDAAAYATLEARGARVEEGLRRALRDRGIEATLHRVGSMWTLFFGVDRVRDYGDARGADTGRYARFFHAMLDRGVYLPPSQFEACFVSLAHGEDEVDEYLRAADEALRTL
jgi:glutamate-1-semialdehyde 2,1-aminomutase